MSEGRRIRHSIPFRSQSWGGRLTRGHGKREYKNHRTGNYLNGHPGAAARPHRHNIMLYVWHTAVSVACYGVSEPELGICLKLDNQLHGMGILSLLIGPSPPHDDDDDCTRSLELQRIVYQ